MSEQMTLENVRNWLKKPPKALENIYRGKSRKSYADEARELADAIDAHLNAAKGEAVATDKVTLTAPERIYLQISDEPAHRNEEFSDAEVTWCSESVLACEVKYIRADLAKDVSPDVVRDAERYRWLCEQCEGDGLFIASGSTGTWGECGHSDWAGMKELLDERIDEAMAAREGGK